MKLHLPKQLFTALLAALFAAAIPQTLAGDSLSINFYQGNEKKIGSTTEGQTLFGVDVTDWNDVTATGSQTQQLVVTTAEEKSMLLTLTTPQAAWGPNEANTATLEDKLQANYLDVSAGTNGNAWQIALQGGDAWIMDATFYMAGDGGTYDPLTVNGKTYIGGVDTEGNTAWGERSTNSDGSVSYSTVEGYDGTSAINDVDLNSYRAVRVTSLMGVMTATNASNTDGRGSLAGLQVVDVTDSKVYAATLGSDAAALSEVSWSKQGVETPSTLEGISESERYLSVTADAAGSTLNVAADTTIAGLQLAANSLTVDGSGTLTVGALHAKEGTTLTMNTALAGESLVLSGCGSISLNDYTYTGEVSVLSSTTVQLQAGTQSVGSFVNYGTVKLAIGVVPGFLINNSGSVQLQQGSGDLTLNNLVDKDAGTYKPSVITNTASGDIVIDNTGNKSLNANITLANGGKVTLKSGTFGTADVAITHKITGENSTTLVLDGVTSYISGDRRIAVNLLLKDSTLHLGSGDVLDYNYSNGTTVTTVGQNSRLDVGANRQSLRNASLSLTGGVIYGAGDLYSWGDNIFTAGLDFYDAGTIDASSGSSIIATGIAARDSGETLTFKVGANATLTIGAYTVDGVEYRGSLVGKGSFSKTESGTLIYKGAEFTNGLTISGGVFEYYLENNRAHSGSISGSGTFRKSGSGTLTLDSANTSVTTLNVAGGKLVYNSSTDTTHTISGASGSTFEKTGSGTLTANTSSLASELLISEGTLKLSSAMESDRRATVADGATLDVNGNAAYYNLTLQEGATLTNTHTEAAPDSTGTGKKQLHTITLEGDAKVTGTSQFGMVGNGWGQATLNLNGNTLTKEGSNTFHLYNTRVQSAGLIQVNGGKVITHGGQGSGTLDLTRASIGIDGGEFELGGVSQSIQNLTLTSGTLTIGNGLTLTALGDTTMSGGTVSGNLCLSGTITLNGSVNMSGATLSGTSLGGFTLLASAKPANSGLNSLTYQLWSGDGSVNSSQSTISVGGVNYEMNAATGTFTTAGTVYYVATGDTITVGGDSAAEGTASATSFVVDGTLSVTADTSTESVIGTAGTVSVAESTTLTLTGTDDSFIGTLSAAGASVALAAGSTLYLGQTGADAQETTSSIGTVNVASDAGTIYLNEKASLETITKTGEGTLTLNGSGTYTLASVKESASDNNAVDMTTGVSLSSAWTGKVKVTDSQIMGVNLNSLGNANSSVLLNGLGTWINTSHKTINTNLILENYSDTRSAFIITDHSQNNEYWFNGKVSGTGDFELASRASTAATFIFAGDTSDWSGGIIVNTSFNGDPYTDKTINVTPTFTVKLTGGGDVFDPEGADGVSMNRAGTLNLHIGKAGVETRMNGAITKNSNSTLDLTVLGDTVFNKNVTVNSLIGSSEVEISNSAVMNVSKLSGFNGHITVDKTGTGAASLTASVESGALDMAGLTLNNGATATIKTRISNGNTLGKDISLGDVAVNGGSTLTIHFSGNESRTATLDTLSIDGTATVEANNYQGQISIGELNSTGTTNELTLKASTPSDSGRTVFNLNDGAFAGTINFVANPSNTRKIALNIKDATVAQDAVINISKSAGNNHQMGLGIGATQVTVKGIQDGQTVSTAMGIYSGQQAFGNYDDLASDTTFRTLIIDTDGSDNAVSANSTTSAALGSYLNLEKQGLGSQTFSGNVSAFNGTLNVQGGTLEFVGTGGFNATTATLSGAGNLTLKGGSESTPVIYNVGSVTSSDTAGITLGDYTTLNLTDTLDSRYNGNGNSDPVASLDLAITGGSNSRLNLYLDSNTGWEYNNTVRLTALTGDKTVSEVHVSGALAAGVFGNTVFTDLGGARLVLADESTLVVRKNGTFDFGAGSIELQGTTTMNLYDGVTAAGAVISNDISGSKLVAGTSTQGGVTFTGSVDLEELVVNVDSSKKVILSGESEKKLQKLTVNSGKKLEIANVSTLQMTDAEGNTKVSISGTGSSAATLTAKSDNALVEMQSATSFSISDMVLSNVKLSAVAGASVALNNVSGTAELAGAGSYNIGTGAAQYTLGMVGAMENDNGGTALTLKYTSDLAITMSGTDSQLLLSADPTVDANGIFGTYNLTLTLNYTLAGDLASAETVNWQDLVGFTGILGDLLTAQTPGATVDLAEGEAAVAAAGTTPTVEYNYTAPQGDAQVGTLVITINGLNVPEPASATLGLAALMMLCARRRRKA